MKFQYNNNDLLMVHFYILYNGFTNCKIIKGNYTIHTNISLLCKNYLVLLYDLQALGISELLSLFVPDIGKLKNY